ncbi:MAG: nucleoside deaminase [Gammaproteobacteria bacterium]
MSKSAPEQFMQAAIDAALKGVRAGLGGPFGACIVHENKIIAATHNTVLGDQDPTCHAEMNAIRAAAKHLNTHILEHCILYTTAEPCPMCLSAIYWARIPEYYVGVNRETAAEFGFDDRFFYEELAQPAPKRTLKSHENIQAPACRAVFETWQALNGTLY